MKIDGLYPKSFIDPWSLGVSCSKRRMIRLANLNIGTLTGKSTKLVNAMKRRVIVAYLQEPKWKGDGGKCRR